MVQHTRGFRAVRRRLQRLASCGSLLAVLIVCGLVESEAFAVDPLSTKRGFADVGASFGELQITNSGWYYTWGPSKPAAAAASDAEFLPMIWWGGQANQTNIDRIKGYGDVEWVLGFNEPERSDQANMSVDAAIAAWRTLDAGFRDTDIKLVSPAPSDTGDGQAWLADFMSRANAERLKVDAVAFHWYGVSTPDNPIGAANSLLNRVSAYRNQYNLPVMITEFAIHDWGGNYTDEEIRGANEAFLDYLLPRLESRDYVEKYAFYNWFSDARLFEGNPTALTNVGRAYVGVIDVGEVYDLSGRDFGTRVAYLTGGDLTHTAGAAGEVNHVNALEGVSTLSGSVDWGLDAGGWVRVQRGATLRKASANRVTFDAIQTTNDGVIEVAGGVLAIENARIGGAGEFVVSAGGRLELGADSQASPASLPRKVELEGGVLASPLPLGLIVTDELRGSGQVASSLLAAGSSLVRVGASSGDFEAGVMRVNGDYAADAGSELQLDIASPADHDRLLVTGDFSAGGTLRVSLAGVIPQPGDTFDILRFASASGEFDSLALPALPDQAGWDLSRLYTDGALSVTATPGDYNDDGIVDLADYTVWRDHVSEPAGALPNDTAGGAIGDAQLIVWRSSYGLTSIDAVTVPEPATWAMLSAVFAACRRRST